MDRFWDTFILPFLCACVWWWWSHNPTSLDGGTPPFPQTVPHTYHTLPAKFMPVETGFSFLVPTSGSKDTQCGWPGRPPPPPSRAETRPWALPQHYYNFNLAQEAGLYLIWTDVHCSPSSIFGSGGGRHYPPQQDFPSVLVFPMAVVAVLTPAQTWSKDIPMEQASPAKMPACLPGP